MEDPKRADMSDIINTDVVIGEAAWLLEGHSHRDRAWLDARLRETSQLLVAVTTERDALRAQVEARQAECDIIAGINHGQWLALENVRLLAARHRAEEWAQHMLRFCEEAGNSGSPLRAARVPAPAPADSSGCTACATCGAPVSADAPALHHALTAARRWIVGSGHADHCEYDERCDCGFTATVEGIDAALAAKGAAS